MRCIYALMLIVLVSGCDKYLGIQPKGKMIPTTVADFRLLLDDDNLLNSSPALGELSSDNITISDAAFRQIGNYFERSAYTWAKDYFTPQDQPIDWNTPYEQVYVSNLILEGLGKTNTGSEAERNKVKGEALFYRGVAFYNIAVTFCNTYNPASAAQEPGVPLRLSSDVFAISVRANLKNSFEQIVADLSNAAPLLPSTIEHRTRPTKAAAHGMLARVYLYMGEYEKALEEAEKSIAIYPMLVDYNKVNPDKFFMPYNDETLHYARIPYEFNYVGTCAINAELFNQFEETDLRKTLCFWEDRGEIRYTSYAGWEKFTGLATDEVYLIAAECYARTGALTEALEKLHQLRRFRYREDAYVRFSSTEKEVVISKVLEERRKELIFRNVRWSDLKRLNADPARATTLKRTVLGVEYTLQPGSPRFALPIPASVINATGMQQNPR